MSKWPHATPDWLGVPKNTTSLFVNRKYAGTLEPLRELKRLRQLSVALIREQDVGHVASLRELKTLVITSPSTDGIRWLTPLRKLESLGIRAAAKLNSLSGIDSLSNLKHLYCEHIPRVRSLRPLESLGNLEELILEQSMGTDKPLRFDSLEPISNHPHLRCVILRGVKVDDGSLRPLATLPCLRNLFPGSYAVDIHQLAFLAARLNRQLVKEDRLASTRPLPEPHWPRCRTCQNAQVQLIGKVGSRYRLLACPDCDKDLIAERDKIFQAQRNDAIAIRSAHKRGD
jgi:hypothetical protein